MRGSNFVQEIGQFINGTADALGSSDDEVRKEAARSMGDWMDENFNRARDVVANDALVAIWHDYRQLLKALETNGSPEAGQVAISYGAHLFEIVRSDAGRSL